MRAGPAARAAPDEATADCARALQPPGTATPRASPRDAPGPSVAALARRFMQRSAPPPEPEPERPTVEGERMGWSFPAILGAFKAIEVWTMLTYRTILLAAFRADHRWLTHLLVPCH